MATDDPPRNLLPTFSQPPPPPATAPPTPDPSTSPETDLTPPPRMGILRRLKASDGGGSAGVTSPQGNGLDEDTPTGTSSPASKPTAAQTAALVAAVVGMAAAGAALLVRWRLRAALRQPSKTERADIAAPLARIALRHADLSWLNRDLADLLDTGNAVGAYLNNGPLLGPLQPEPEIPADLQEPRA